MYGSQADLLDGSLLRELEGLRLDEPASYNAYAQGRWQHLQTVAARHHGSIQW